MTNPKVFHTIAEFRAWRGTLGSGAPVAFVPTMGALHAGHASLVRYAREVAGPAGAVCTSLFVNPTQFGPGEDLAKYPRTFDADLALIAGAGGDAVFAPANEEMYPGIAQLSTQHSSLSTSIDPGPIATLLEGVVRPGHFRGVCTVVLKLLNIVSPTHLVMGQKDYQQNAILRQVIRDLNVRVEHITCPTIREHDGLAMSSRNRYLSADERPRAGAIFEVLSWAAAQFIDGQRNGPALEAGMRQIIEARGLTVQYALPADRDTLAAFPGSIPGPCVFLVAAKLGGTRLIDNMLSS